MFAITKNRWEVFATVGRGTLAVAARELLEALLDGRPIELPDSIRSLFPDIRKKHGGKLLIVTDGALHHTPIAAVLAEAGMLESYESLF